MGDNISFLRGVPADEAMDNMVYYFRWGMNAAIDYFGVNILLYTKPKQADFNGFWPLKKIIAQKYGVADDWNERIICTNGGMESITYLFKSLSPGDAIAVENATYDRILNDAKRHHLQVVGINSDRSGVDVEDLEVKLKTGLIKMFYHIIFHQNPVGNNASLSSIMRIADICKKYGVLYVCDIAYEELNYSGEKNLCPDPNDPVFENTCFVGSFTKTLAPGPKCGFGIFPSAVTSMLTPIIANSRLNPNYPTQAYVYEIMKSGKFDEIIKFLIKLYKPRMNALNSSLQKYFSDTPLTKLTGGFFSLLELEGVKDAKSFMQRVKERGVIITPAEVFAPNSESLKKKDFLPIRLAFPALTEEQIKTGIKIIADEYHNL